MLAGNGVRHLLTAPLGFQGAFFVARGARCARRTSWAPAFDVSTVPTTVYVGRTELEQLAPGQKCEEKLVKEHPEGAVCAVGEGKAPHGRTCLSDHVRG